MTFEDWNKKGIKDYYGRPVALIEEDKYGRVVITFTDHTVLTGTPEGDCCANTVIDAITGDFTPGEPLVEIKTVGGDSTDDEDGYGVTDDFMEVITVGDKDVAVQCKCYHNGYYGGWVDWRVTAGWESA